MRTWSHNATANTDRDTRTERFGVREFRPLSEYSNARQAKEENRSKAEKEQSQGLAFSLTAPLAFRSLPLLTFSGKAIPCQSAARNLRTNNSEALRICQLSPIVAVRLFIEVAEQVERLDTDVRAMELPLYQTPEIIHCVRVDVSTGVLYGVIYDGMLIMHGQPVIGFQSVAEQRRTRLYVIANALVKFMFATRRDGERADVTAALHHAESDGLVRATSASDGTLALRPMHVARFATNERLVNLNLTRQLCSCLILHGFANPVKHKPRRLLSDTEITRYFAATNAVATVGHEPHSGEPLIKRDRGFIQYGTDLHGKLLAARRRFTLQDSARLKEHRFLRSAVGALNPVRPPLGREVLQ